MGGRGSRRSLQLRDSVTGLTRVQANLTKTQQPNQAQTHSQPHPKSRATTATLVAGFESAGAPSRPQDGTMGGRGSRRSLQARQSSGTTKTAKHSYVSNRDREQPAR